MLNEHGADVGEGGVCDRRRRDRVDREHVAIRQREADGGVPVAAEAVLPGVRALPIAGTMSADLRPCDALDVRVRRRKAAGHGDAAARRTAARPCRRRRRRRRSPSSSGCRCGSRRRRRRCTVGRRGERPRRVGEERHDRRAASRRASCRGSSASKTQTSARPMPGVVSCGLRRSRCDVLPRARTVLSRGARS